jgi:hypothetical protein
VEAGLQAAGKLLRSIERSMDCTSNVTEDYRAGCSKRPFSKAAASEEVKRTLRYVELLSEARTPLGVFFSILLEQWTITEGQDQS